MSSQPGPNNSSMTDEELRILQFNKKRFDTLSYMLGNTFVDAGHQDWVTAQRNLQNRAESTNQGATYQSCPPPQYDQGNELPFRNRSEFPHKWARIHDPTNGLLRNVKVFEDTGTGVNFISPAIARASNLTPQLTAEVRHTVMTGDTFISNKWVKVHWIGSGNNHSAHWFYLAPERAPIELLVGKQFLNENADVFMSTEFPTEPAFLNVQGKIRNDEKVEIQANQTAAAAQSAELEEKRKQEKRQKQKQKESASSSRRDSSLKKRKN